MSRTDIIIALYGTAVVFAITQAIVHSPIIKAKKMNADVKKVWTIARGALFIFVAVAVAANMQMFFSMLFACVGMFFVFAVVFPFALNSIMGWHLFYLGSTSKFDVLTLSKVTGYTKAEVRAGHDHYYQNRDWYKKAVHKAGRITAVAFSLCAVVLFLIARVV